MRVGRRLSDRLGRALAVLLAGSMAVPPPARKSDLKTRETITGLFTNGAGQFVPGSRSTFYLDADDPTRPTTWRNDGHRAARSSTSPGSRQGPN